MIKCTIIHLVQRQLTHQHMGQGWVLEAAIIGTLPHEQDCVVCLIQHLGEWDKSKALVLTLVTDIFVLMSTRGLLLPELLAIQKYRAEQAGSSFPIGAAQEMECVTNKAAFRH